MNVVIEKLVMPGVYLVSDSLGRQFRVQSSSLWRVGQRVLVLNGNVVGPSNRPPIVTRVEV